MAGGGNPGPLGHHSRCRSRSCLSTPGCGCPEKGSSEETLIDLVQGHMSSNLGMFAKYLPGCQGEFLRSTESLTMSTSVQPLDSGSLSPLSSDLGMVIGMENKLPPTGVSCRQGTQTLPISRPEWEPEIYQCPPMSGRFVPILCGRRLSEMPRQDEGVLHTAFI